MIDENLTEAQDATNPEVEVLEETTEEETVETPAEVVQEETVPKSQFNQVLARAKKAEEALKKNKPAENITNKQTTVPTDEVEEKVLLAQGMSEELMVDLKAVAKARGKGLIQSQNDPIFIAIKNEKEAASKAAKARLGASKGSPVVKKAKEITSPGLSDEDHRQLWRDAQNN